MICDALLTTAGSISGNTVTYQATNGTNARLLDAALPTTQADPNGGPQ